jgi:two-component system, OmpR family, sensor histidine kinase KdpD
MARIEAGRVILRRASHSVQELVESVLDKLRTVVEDRHIEVNIAAGLPLVWVDGELIEVALRQLVDNALKYSPAGSPVSLTGKSKDGRVIVSVADQGPGIPEAEQGRIFEKFYRAEASRHQIPGAGLGLVIAREIIHAHGGEIWVESQPGEGSIFQFTLPSAEKEQA